MRHYVQNKQTSIHQCLCLYTCSSIRGCHVNVKTTVIPKSSPIVIITVITQNVVITNNVSRPLSHRRVHHSPPWIEVWAHTAVDHFTHTPKSANHSTHGPKSAFNARASWTEVSAWDVNAFHQCRQTDSERETTPKKHTQEKIQSMRQGRFEERLNQTDKICLPNRLWVIRHNVCSDIFQTKMWVNSTNEQRHIVISHHNRRNRHITSNVNELNSGSVAKKPVKYCVSPSPISKR